MAWSFNPFTGNFDNTSAFVSSDLNYVGLWNASTNSPAIPAASAANKNSYYIVSVAGSTSVSGISSWDIGDWIISNGSSWQKLIGADAGINSVGAGLGLSSGVLSLGDGAGLTYDGTNRALTLGGATVTTSQPVLNLSQTWNAGAVTFTGLKFNATDTASASGSLLLDLQVGGTSVLSLGHKNNGSNGPQLKLSDNGSGYAKFVIGSSSYIQMIPIYMEIVPSSGLPVVIGTSLGIGNTDTRLTRAAAATLQLGAADAAAPVAQTLQVQSVVAGGAGASDVAGANFTIKGSAGRGSGAGGSIIFQVAPAGSAGTGAQNAYADALTISSGRTFTFTYASGEVFKINQTSGSISGNASNTFGTVFINGDQAGGFASCVSLGGPGAEGVTVRSGAFFAFSAYSTRALHSEKDTILVRDAANTLALRNGANAQRFNSYRSYTDASNYSRFSLHWNTSTALVMAEGAGTGVDGSVAFNDAALATDATRGFIMVPSCAGTPTGTPADVPTGQIPLVWDSTNLKLYVYTGGAWKASAAFT